MLYKPEKNLVIDMDGVSCQFVPAICREYEKVYGGIIKPDDIVGWDMRQFGIPDDLWIKPGFFASLEPMPGAIESLYYLKEKYGIIIATDAMGLDFVKEEKYDWLLRYLPFVDQVYFLSDKSKVPGFLLFDDAPHHLEQFPGITVKMITPYNVSTKAHYSVEDWQGFRKLLFDGSIERSSK